MLEQSVAKGLVVVPPIPEEVVVVVCSFAQDKMLAASPLLAKASSRPTSLPFEFGDLEGVTRCEVRLLMPETTVSKGGRQ